jgi:hypothetical protein
LIASRFNSHPIRFSLLAVCLFFASLSLASAQSATTGAIGGTITDNGGALLPAATITVKSADTGVTRTAKSNASGEYRVTELEPGNYTVSFAADGFAPFRDESIVVTVGSLSTVSPVLKPGSVNDSVVVTAEESLLHAQSNDISTTLDQASIDNLPINGRRWSNFALLTPGVVSNSDGFGLLSFRGISFLLNNNTVDGADDNQAYFSEARGRTRAAYSITQAAIQEFQVNTSNYSAQYGRSAGGVINTVTKSGGNQLHGELFFYDRDNDLGGATNPYTLLSMANGSGSYNDVPYKPTDWRKQWGFGAGGPLKRDKFFWFYAYDQGRRNFPGTGRAHDTNDTFAPSNTNLATGESCTGTNFTATGLTLATEGDYNACAIAAQLGFPGNFQAGSAYYQQGLGIVNSFLGTVPRTLDQVINLPKLDWQINDKNRLSLMYNRMRESSPNGFQTQTSVFYGRASFGNDFVKEDFGIARLTSVLSNSIVNDALVQYGRDFEYSLSDAPLPNELPLSVNPFGKPAETTIGYEFQGGFNIGKNEDLDRAADPDERRLQLLDGATWSHGKHVAKAGLEFNRVVDYVNNLYDGNGNYSYDYTYDFISDYLHATTGLGGANYNSLYYSYGQAFGNPAAEIATREYAGYATDDWRLLPNLTLTLGARYEYEYVPGNPMVNPALPQSADRPDDRNNIAPRVGFAWDPYGDHKTTIRGGYGMYFGRIINSNILQTYQESGASNAQINETGLYGTSGPSFPNLLPLSNQPSATTVAYLDPHMQNPQVHEADLAIEQDLGHNTVFGLTYMMSLGRELPSAIDVNVNDQNTYNFTFSIAPQPLASATNQYPITQQGPGAEADAPPSPTQTGYVVQPHGGKNVPFAVNQSFTTKVFVQSLNGGATRPNPAYGEILDVKSDVNSSYHALAVQLNHRWEHGFSLMTNYTWSHAMDDNPYLSTVVPSFSAYDPTDLQLEHGNSSLDVRQRFVFAAVYQPQTHFHGLMEELVGGWRIAPLVQLQTGLPYTPYVSGSTGAYNQLSNPTGLWVPSGTEIGSATCGSTATPAQSIVITGQPTVQGCPLTPAYKGLNGSGSSADRLPWIDRNTYNYPKTAVYDLRMGKNFYLPGRFFEGTRLEFFAEMFNVMNHQNITGVNDEAYTLKGTALTPYTSFGVYTNSNSNYTYSPRQMQIAARFHF